MDSSRHTLSSTTPPLTCSVSVPRDAVAIEMGNVEVDLTEPTQSMPIGGFALSAEEILIAVAHRPAYETGSVMQWMQYLCEFFGQTITRSERASFGPSRTHEGILLETERTDPDFGPPMRCVIAAFEDGGRFVTVHARCPSAAWPAWREQLRASVLSIELSSPLGRTRDVDSMSAPGWKRVDPEEYRRESERYVERRRAELEPVIEEAERLVGALRFDDAEQLIRTADSSILGAVALARLYERALERHAQEGGSDPQSIRERAELLRRAIDAADRCYPDPHTAMEAEQFEAGRAESTARLRGIAGDDAVRALR